MRNISLKIAIAFVVITTAAPAGAYSDAELTAIRDGFEQRRDTMIRRLKGEEFKPAAKRPPLKPGRGRYTRHYSYSVTDFAMKSYWLNHQLPEANAALAENCRFYTDNPLERNDRDSFYWASDVICRMVEFFGSRGSIAPGRLDATTEATVLEMAWQYCLDNSTLAEADVSKSQTWHIGESENHHLQKFSSLWHFTKFLKGAPAYQSRRLADGHTPAEHHAAWTEYTKEFFTERAHKGLFVEIASNGYGFQSLKCVYGFYDFAEDPTLKQRARQFLDLYWACWAQEQIDHVRGGGKTRVYQETNSQTDYNNRLGQIANYYLGTGYLVEPNGNLYSALTSDYRLPLVVMDIALDRAGRGAYEVVERRMGLVEEGYWTPPDYRMRTDFGGILRYTYCTPEFVMGALMLEARPHEDWAMISSQNRWQGVIFRGHPNARIFPQCRAASDRRTFNQQWAVQHQSTMIAQKLDPNGAARHAKEMRVWFASAGLNNRVERAGWAFVEAAGAWAAVRPARDGYRWAANEVGAPGDWLVPDDELTPVIIEVAQKSDYPSYRAFQNAITACAITLNNSVLTYTNPAGHTFTFHTDYSALPRVNGQTVDLQPPAVFNSPFIQSPWNSGVVTIQKDDRKLTLDFN
ncbi:MAG: hypothetical protein ACYTGQ_00855 [Planctomycetota bacterium]|jgi:hypothetical protein